MCTEALTVTAWQSANWSHWRPGGPTTTNTTSRVSVYLRQGHTCWATWMGKVAGERVIRTAKGILGQLPKCRGKLTALMNWQNQQDNGLEQLEVKSNYLFTTYLKSALNNYNASLILIWSDLFNNGAYIRDSSTANDTNYFEYFTRELLKMPNLYNTTICTYVYTTIQFENIKVSDLICFPVFLFYILFLIYLINSTFNSTLNWLSNINFN